MLRLLTIDGDSKRAQALAMECLEQKTAVHMAETLCEGVRYLLEAPVSVVVADVAALRMAGRDHARVFEAVAPGVPVIIAVNAGARVEDVVDLELQGFHVVSRPFALRDLLAKVEVPARTAPARRDARAQLAALCG